MKRVKRIGIIHVMKKFFSSILTSFYHVFKNHFDSTLSGVQESLLCYITFSGTERFIVSIITAGLKFRIKFILSIDEGVQQLPISALEISRIYKNAQNGLKVLFTKAPRNFFF